MRAAQEALDAGSQTPHSNNQREKLLRNRSSVRVLFNPIIVEENDNVIAGHSMLSV
jgi:hypothetical protein